VTTWWRELKIIGKQENCSCLPQPRSPWFKEGRRRHRGSSSAGWVCPHLLEKREHAVVTKRESFCVHKLTKLSSLTTNVRTFSINFYSENTNLEYRYFLFIRPRRPSIAGRPSEEQPLQFLK
jgi:hypothetical protein